MKLFILLTFASAVAFPLNAQQPTVDNAKLETRALSGTVAAELARAGAGPFWAAYSEPIIAGQHGDMCSWYGNGNDDYSGRTPGTPMRLEGEIALVILIRMENNRVDRLRTISPDCHLDAGGLPFIYITNVSVAESLAWLKTQAAGQFSDQAIMAISQHQSSEADKVLDDLAQPAQPVEIRKRAAMWLGNSRGTRGTATLKRMLANDPNADVRDRAIQALSRSKDPAGIPLVIEAARTDKDPHNRGQALFWLAQRAQSQVSKDAINNAVDNDPDSAVRERAVFALTQMPNGEGVPRLIELAKTHRDPNVRKKAMFWLGQSKDPRAVDFFAQVLKP